LGTAQEQHGQNGNFWAREVKYFLQSLFVLGYTAIGATGGAGHALLLETFHGVAHGVFV
jgi:hypothetical protein